MSHNTVFKDKKLEEEKELGYIHPENVTAMRRDSLIETGSRREGGLYYSHRPEKNESWIFADVQLHGITVGTVAFGGQQPAFPGIGLGTAGALS